MIFIIIPIVVLAAVVLLLIIRKYTSLEFVQHARLIWRMWSVRLAALAAAIQAIAADTPQSLIDAWNSLPPDVKGVISPDTMHYLSSALMVASFLSQLVRQQKLKARADEMRGNP